MKLFYFVLNDTEKLDAILKGFIDNGIKEATIVESKGMLRLLNCTHCGEDIPFLDTVRLFVKPDWNTSNLILAALEDEQVPLAIAVIENCIGDLNNKDTGVVFTVPIDFTKGFYKDGE